MNIEEKRTLVRMQKQMSLQDEAIKRLGAELANLARRLGDLETKPRRRARRQDSGQADG